MDDGTINVEAQEAPEISRPTSEPSPTRKPAKRKTAKKRAGRKRVGTPVVREQGGIGFVYYDLETAINIAKAMLDAGAGQITRDQLAGLLGLSATGGTFIMRVAAARSFGLVGFGQGKYELTPLGFEVLGPEEKGRRAARATAFLTVPLFARVYAEFRGKPLPPRPHGLEHAFVRMGVPDKQRGMARVAFDKSAKQAGFFDAGNDRLVEPIISGPVPGSAALSGTSALHADPMVQKTDAETSSSQGRRHTDKIAPDLHPFIEGLLETLPDVGSEWFAEGRRKWLQTAIHIFDMLYKDDEKNPTSITISSTPV